MPTTTGRRPSSVLAGALAVLVVLSPAVAASVAPYGGLGPPGLLDTFDEAGLGGSTVEMVNPTLFDNFTSGPTTVGNPIVEWGGVRVDSDMLLEDGRFVSDLVGLAEPLAPIEGYSEDETRRVYESMVQLQIDSGLSDDARERIEEVVLMPPSTPPLPLPTFDEIVDDLVDLGLLPEDGLDIAQQVLDERGLVGDPTLGPRPSVLPFVPGFDTLPDLDGYLLVGDAPQIDGAYLPRSYDDATGPGGVDLLAVRQQLPFGSPPGGGRAENVLRLNIPMPMTLPGGSVVGGPTYNGSFPGDIFNDANVVIVVRDEGGVRSRSTLAFQDQVWSEIEPVGIVGVADRTTIFGLPPAVLDAADGLGFATFVQDGPQQQEGSVGSSVVPDFGALIDPSDVGLFTPMPLEIAPEFDELAEAAPEATDPPAAAAPEPSVSDEAPSSEEGAEADDEAGSNLLAIVLILGGLGAAGLGAWLWLGRRNAGDPCEELRRKAAAAQQACERARGVEADAKADCEAGRRKVTTIRGKIAALRRSWPPAFEDGPGAWIEDGQGNRVTSADLHARRQALGPIWDQYRAGALSAQEVEAHWERADTPEFRDELRAKTAAKQAEAAALERDLQTADAAAATACDGLGAAERAATTACQAHEAAKKAYEECIGRASAAAAQAAADAATAAAAEASSPAAEPAPAVAASPPAAPEPVRFVGSRPIRLDTSGLSGDELRRAEYLEEIFAEWKGTGDLAGVAEALYEFQEWHLGTFDEPWFEWTTATSNETPTGTAGHIERFAQTRKMACYEFVHFCAYIASDQVVRQRMGGEDDAPVLEDDYSASWNFVDEINTDTTAFDADTAARGEVVTGVSRVDSWNNSAGYYHTGIYVGDGQVISLGGGGLLLEDTRGIVDATFHRVGYGDVQVGPYRYGTLNAPPGTTTGN